jgi:hypothetical protein
MYSFISIAPQNPKTPSIFLILNIYNKQYANKKEVKRHSRPPIGRG